MLEPRRILIVDNLCVESSRREIYRELARTVGWQIHLLVPNSWREQGEIYYSDPEPKNSCLAIHTTGIMFGHRAHRVLYSGLHTAIRKVRPHVLFIDTEPENYAALEALTLRRLFVPHAVLSLVSSRNIDHLSVGFPYRFSFTHHICDFLVRHSSVDLVFCRPRETLTFATSYAAKVCYLPHSVDCSLFTPQSRDDVSRARTTTIGFVGRIVESKGIQVLIEAFAELPPNARLQLVGCGDYAQVVEQQAARHGIKERVTVRPAVPYLEMPAVMRGLDVLVLPSLETRYWTEQFGRVLIEAMASGVPVVASASGGIPDVIGDAGLLFKTGDANELAARLMQLLQDPDLRRQYAERGRARALAEYDVPVLARRLHTAILDAVESRGRRFR